MKTILFYPRTESVKFREFFLSLMSEGRRRGWRFVAVDRTPGPDEAERVRAICSDLKVAGWVGYHVGKPVSAALSGIPTVFFNSGHCPPGVPLVRHDNAAFGTLAAEALGFDEENYAVVGFSGIRWSRAREQAFAARLHEHGLDCKAIRVDAPSFKPYAAQDALRRAFSRLRRPVSVFAVNDSLADAVLASAESLGWHCPHDLRIVGCDDDELICMASPVTLSSVRPDWGLGGRLVAEALEIQMRGGRPMRDYVYGAAGVARRASTRVPYRRPVDDRVERGRLIPSDTPQGFPTSWPTSGWSLSRSGVRDRTCCLFPSRCSGARPSRRERPGEPHRGRMVRVEPRGRAETPRRRP